MLSLGAPFMLGACSTVPANAIPAPSGFIPRPTVRSGQSWRYALINRYNGEQISEVTARVATVQPELRIELTDSTGKRLPDEVYASPWQVRQEPIYNETLVFDDPVPLLPAQLAVGANSMTHTRYRLSGEGTPHPWQVRLLSRGWERIHVPAGQFDALRVERRIDFEHHDLFRRGSRRVDTLWYAPAANRWVMRDWTGYYLEDGASPFGFGLSLHSGRADRYDSLGWHNRATMRSGFGPGFFEEGEDAVRWVMLDQQAAPVA
jgi:hypothetical protein